jgi:hypothetical protein
LSYSKRYGAHENIVGGKCMYSEIGDGCGKVVGKYTLKKVTSVREFMEFSYLNGEKIGGWEAVLLNNRHEIVLTEKELVEATCMSVDEIRKYDKGNNWLSGWFISNVVAFDNPKELIEFRTGPYPEDVVVRAPMSWMYIEA